MFDPNRYRERCENYLSQVLGCQVVLILAERLVQSTREAPWRLDIRAGGVVKSYVLQLDARGIEYEYRVLKAMEAIPLPTPRVYGLDLQGDALGTPCFFSDFIVGESLLEALEAGEAWAETLYMDAVCALQAVTAGDLGVLAEELTHETARDVLEDAYDFLKGQSLPIAEAAYAALKADMPALPPVCFSNGDLWVDNFLFKDRKLSGVIDFQNASFSDPIYEFLLSFFASPELQGRGTEARFCHRIGADPALLDWYHGLEYFDTLRWVLLSGKPFVHHTAESLQADLKKWLEAVQS